MPLLQPEENKWNSQSRLRTPQSSAAAASWSAFSRGGSSPPRAQFLDGASGKYITGVLKSGDLEGSLGKTLLLRGVRRVAAERVLLVGLGKEREFTEQAYRTALSAAAKALKATGAADANVFLTDLPVKRRATGWKVEQAVAAFMDGAYRFDRLKSKPARARNALRKVTLDVAERTHVTEGEAAVARAVAIAEGVALARDLGNLPGNHCTPTYLAEQAVEALGKRSGFKVQVLERKDCEALGMGSSLAVAQGSKQPPKFIVMEYMGGKRGAAPVGWSGRASPSTPAASPSSPRLDGGDEVRHVRGSDRFGTMKAIASMKLPLNVVAVVPAVESMPGGRAFKPGMS